MRPTAKQQKVQPSHSIFLDRQHHGLHIASLLVNQLKSRARELDVRLNSVDTTKYVHPRACIATLKHSHTRTPNLINDTILSLSRYGFYLHDAHQPLIVVILQDLLYTQSSAHLLDLPSTSHLHTPTPVIPLFSFRTQSYPYPSRSSTRVT